MASKDWMPGSGEAVLRMATTWTGFLPAVREKTNMPEETETELVQKTGAFQGLFQMPQSARTPAMNAEMRTARSELEAFMREVKRRYIFSPPLTEAEVISLGLTPRDNTPTAVDPPKARATGQIVYRGAGAIEVRIAPEAEISEDKRGYHGCKIVYDVKPIDAPPPASERELFDSRFTRRKRETFIFQPIDSGKKVYFSMRYENSKGEAGPWCPVFSAVIP
jgi:hypothetical protein